MEKHVPFKMHPTLALAFAHRKPVISAPPVERGFAFILLLGRCSGGILGKPATCLCAGAEGGDAERATLAIITYLYHLAPGFPTHTLGALPTPGPKSNSPDARTLFKEAREDNLIFQGN